MDWFDYGNPPPRIDRTYGDTGNKRKSDKTGTKFKCKHCGRPTYRFVGTVPVCSYCTKLEPDKWPPLHRD